MENKLKIGNQAEKKYFKQTESGNENNLTAFYFSHDGKFLYFRFRCIESFFYPQHTEYNSPLYEGDIAELMISLGEINKYLEVEVNQNNAQYCVLITNKDGKRDYTIEKIPSTVIKSCVKITHNGWDCDIIINVDDLEKLGFDTNNCYFNAHRQSFDMEKTLHLYSLSPTGNNNFHETDAFLKVDFI